jgi:hypothetical protein
MSNIKDDVPCSETSLRDLDQAANSSMFSPQPGAKPINNGRQKYALFHLEWETETHSDSKRRRLVLILGPILGLIVLALASKSDEILKILGRLFFH